MLYCYEDKNLQFSSTYIFIVINFKTQKGDFAGHCPISNIKAVTMFRCLKKLIGRFVVQE